MTKIEWTNTTWNPIRGCSRVSPGCMNCYAERQAIRQAAPGKPYHGLVQITNGHPQWTGVVHFDEKRLLEPLSWRMPRRVFVNSMSDLYHQNVTDEQRDLIYAVMALTPQHEYQILTKRHAEAWDYFFLKNSQYRLFHIWEAIDKIFPTRTEHSIATKERLFEGGPIPNIIHGFSAENQEYFDKRWDAIGKLGALGFRTMVSCEPLLGPINMGEGRIPDWVIAGGESGPGARPAHPDWFRSLRDQCQKAGKAFFFKQWGAWVKYIDRDKEDPDWRQNYTRINRSDSFRILNLEGGCGFHGERVHVMQRVGKKAAGAVLDGETWKQYPKAQ